MVAQGATKSRGSSRGFIALMVVGYCLGLFVSSPASGQCPPSHYREGQVWENTVSSVFMTISIPLSEFAPNRMVCLAKVFERRYGSRKDVAIMIFSSRDSAVRYTPTPPDYAPANGPTKQRNQSLTFWLSQLHGFYHYD